MTAMDETGIVAYDLEPPLRPGDPGYLLTPHVEPIRMPGNRTTRPRYIPGPLAEGTARVVLDEDYYAGPGFTDYREGADERPRDVFDVPQEQRDRWEAVIAAYQAMQEEIETLVSDRARNPPPAPSQGLPF
jgi:hypothetical protein